MAEYAARLVAQARHLARLDPFRPDQANLRRALSSAYYALFHALIRRASLDLLGADSRRGGLRNAFARAYQHSDMERASRAFAQGRSGLPQSLRSALPEQGVSDELRGLAELFHRLQDERHTADYDLAVRWERDRVLARISAVETALEYLRRERTAPDLHVYLGALLVWSRIVGR